MHPTLRRKDAISQYGIFSLSLECILEIRLLPQRIAGLLCGLWRSPKQEPVRRSGLPPCIEDMDVTRSGITERNT
jgi:hypothetical protein